MRVICRRKSQLVGCKPVVLVLVLVVAVVTSAVGLGASVLGGGGGGIGGCIAVAAGVIRRVRTKLQCRGCGDAVPCGHDVVFWEFQDFELKKTELQN